MAKFRKQASGSPATGRRVSSGKRRWLLWALFAVTLFYGAHVLTGPAGVFKLSELREQRDQVRAEIDSLEARRQALLEERRRLHEDTAYIEALARRELGMARPGEKVYRLVDPDQAGSVRQTSR